MGKEDTCEQRLPEHLASHVESMTAIMAGIRDEEGALNPDTGDSWESDEEAYEAQREYGLGVGSETVITFQTSWGGPSDQFEITVDEDGDITEIRYRFLDWFDGAVRTLHGDEYDTVADFYASDIELVRDMARC